jgi:hypothetical protein
MQKKEKEKNILINDDDDKNRDSRERIQDHNIYPSPCWSELYSTDVNDGDMYCTCIV